jgi:NADPH-dependent curcumin reductase CurA
VLVTGIGSDAAQFAMQIASLSGSSLYATSRSDHKIHLGKQKLGVTGGVNTKNTVVTGKLKSFIKNKCKDLFLFHQTKTEVFGLFYCLLQKCCAHGVA